MKRLLVLGAALLGLSGCVSDYPVYDDYPVYERSRPRIYDARPVVIYEDRYRPRPIYRPPPVYRSYERPPHWRYDRRDRGYDRPRRFREDDRFVDRPYRPRDARPGPRIAQSPPVYDRRLDPPPPPRPEFPDRPRPYIPPQPAD